MLRRFYNKVFGSPDERVIQKHGRLVEEINGLEPEVSRRPDADLRERTDAFRMLVRERTEAAREGLAEADRRLADAGLGRGGAVQQRQRQARQQLYDAEHAVLDDLLPEAFAMVREACRRTLGKRHYDVQLLGGIVLHQGSIAEMKTGEGKTFVAALPLYLHALTGRGAHLVTPNDYLSKVGLQLMGPIYHLLGASAAVIQNQGGGGEAGSFIFDPDFRTSDDRYLSLRPCSRREAYAADITYGTNNEFGFDYLRDNMARGLDGKVQRELHYAIVDEVDNILIDEARTPLIISGVARDSSSHYQRFASLVRQLQAERDYTVAEKERTVSLTEAGIERMETALGIDNLYGSEHAEMLPYLDNALRASVLYRKDVEYLVRDREVVIVDEFTGRMMEGRRFSEGLHQAIEAKEGVTVQRESMTLASITFQNLFRMYPRLAGMTGTAKTEEEELRGIYDLDVVAIPTHKPVIRDDRPDVVYKTKDLKFRQVAAEIKAEHEAGRPVLVGTVAVETSEQLSRQLRRARVPHEVLNAKNHEREATIIAQAGRRGAVTIATNMAGRGVDILLGGNPEGLARDLLRKQKVDLLSIPQGEWTRALDLLDRGEDPHTASDGEWVDTVAEVHRQVEQEQREVLSLGGLHVVGTERHESRRIDNQLRGRSGRLGDPGSSRFYLSLEDDLLLRFGGERVSRIMDRFKMEDAPIEAGMIDRVIENAQVKVEGFYFDSRKNVLQYDEVVNEQRTAIYEQRQLILEAADRVPIARAMIADLVSDQIADAFELGEEEDADEALRPLRAFFPPDSTRLPVPLLEVLEEDRETLRTETEMEEILLGGIDDALTAKLDQCENDDLFRQVLGDVMLGTIDSLWTRHLTDLDHLREGIGLRAVGQIQPIVAYKQEAFNMYSLLQTDILEQTARTLLALQLQVAQPMARRQPAFDRVHLNRQNGSQAAAPVQRRRSAQPGRNDPCPCGSGRKFKHCHMRKRPVPAG